MKKILFLGLSVFLFTTSVQAEVLEFNFLQGAECDGPFSVHQNFDLPPSISVYAGEVHVETGGYMSVYNDTPSNISANFSSHLNVEAKLMTRWAFDHLAIVNDFQHYTDILSSDEYYEENISRNMSQRGQVVHLSEDDQRDLGVLGRIRVSGECYQWFASDQGVQNSEHKFVNVRVRLFYRP